ncbi:MAG: inositol monophosphatase family protein [Myxococcaceae bacterium]
MTTDVSSLRRAAEEAARLSGAVLRTRFTLPRTVHLKGDIDLVTDADHASERVLLDYLRQRFPSHAILSEESGASPGQRPSEGLSPGLKWVVDPLDGTTNYAHNVPHYCVSVAVEDERGWLAGAVFDPMRDEMFTTGRGQGATLNGAPLRASEASDLGRALMCTGFPYDVREHPQASVGLFTRIVRQAQGVRRMGAAALDLAYVAAGRFDGYWEFGLKPWDVGAGALMVEEAGGVLLGIDGGPYETGLADVLACSQGLAPILKKEVGLFLQELGYGPARGRRTARYT